MTIICSRCGGNHMRSECPTLGNFDQFSKANQTRIAYIVWNADRTEGYITFDKQLAYEARKGAKSNCFDENGMQMKLAQAFCEIYSGENDATTQLVVIGEPSKD
jgi:hypothetical protein